MSFIIALITKKQYLWQTQLGIFILLSIALPILNISYLLKNNYIQNFSGYWDFARIDIFFWLFAALAFLYFLKLSLFNIKLQIKFKKAE